MKRPSDPRRVVWTAAVAVVVAAVFAAPAIAFARSPAPPSGRLPFLGATDALVYALDLRAWSEPAEAASVADKFAQGRGAYWGNSGTAVVGGTCSLLHVSALAAMQSLGVLLPVAVVAAWAALTASVLGSWRAGLAAASVGAFVPSFGPWARAWPPQFDAPAASMLPLARPVNPQFSILAWMLVLAFGWAAARRGGRAAIPWLACFGASLAFAGRLYAYNWAMGAAFAGAAFLAASACRDRGQVLVWIGAVALAVAAFLPGASIALPSTPPDAAAAQATTFFHSHRPFVNLHVILCVALAAAGALATRAEDRRGPTCRWMTALLLSFVVAENQQVLSGRTSQPHHFDWFYAPFVIGTGIAWTACAAERRFAVSARVGAWTRAAAGRRATLAAVVLVAAFGVCMAATPLGAALASCVPGVGAAGRVRGAAVGALVVFAGASAWFARRAVTRGDDAAVADVALGCTLVLALAAGVAKQAVGYSKASPRFADMQRLVPALRWIETNGPSGAVVLSEHFCAAETVDVFSSARSFAAERAFMNGGRGIDEDRRRVMILAVVYGFTASEFRAALADTGVFHKACFGNRLFGELREKYAGESFDRSPPLAPGDMDASVGAYESLLADGARKAAASRRIDFVLWDDAWTRIGFRSPARLEFMERAFSAEGVEVWRAKRE